MTRRRRDGRMDRGDDSSRRVRLADLVLSEEKGQQHEQASIMDHPPHVDGALRQPLLVAREVVHVLGYQQSLMGCCGLPHSLCRNKDSGWNNMLDVNFLACLLKPRFGEHLL